MQSRVLLVAMTLGYIAGGSTILFTIAHNRQDALAATRGARYGTRAGSAGALGHCRSGQERRSHPHRPGAAAGQRRARRLDIGRRDRENSAGGELEQIQSCYPFLGLAAPVSSGRLGGVSCVKHCARSKLETLRRFCVKCRRHRASGIRARTGRWLRIALKNAALAFLAIVSTFEQSNNGPRSHHQAKWWGLDSCFPGVRSRSHASVGNCPARRRKRTW